MTIYCVEFKSREGHHNFDFKAESAIERALMIISMSPYYHVQREWVESK